MYCITYIYIYMYTYSGAIIRVHSKGGHSKSYKNIELQFRHISFAWGNTNFPLAMLYTFAAFAMAPFAMDPNECSICIYIYT